LNWFLEVLSNDVSLSEVCQGYGASKSTLSGWVKSLKERGPGA